MGIGSKSWVAFEEWLETEAESAKPEAGTSWAAVAGSGAGGLVAVL